MGCKKGGFAPIDAAANPFDDNGASLAPDMDLLFRMIRESDALIVLATKMVEAAAERRRLAAARKAKLEMEAAEDERQKPAPAKEAKR